MSLPAQVEAHKQSGFFGRFLEMSCPDGQGLVVTLEAYFDESERTAGTFAVAGYAFAPAQAKKFSKEWSQLFDGRIAHMTDLVAKQRAFTGIASHERDRLIREAVKIINKRITFGVSISVNVAEVNALSPRWIQGFGHAYPVCCHFVMAGIGTAITNSGMNDEVAYIFESGHVFEAETRRFIGHVATDGGPLKDFYRYHSDAFLPKTDAVPLQAADLLAWEWTKCQDETRDRGLRPIRQSLLALFRHDVKRYTVRHFTGPLLQKYLTTVRDLGLMQIEEEEIRGKFPHLLPPRGRGWSGGL